MNTYVAVDIGASSGRLMLGQIENGKLELQEMHRFKNGFLKEANHERWQIDYLIQEIFQGLEKIKRAGYSRITLGIDTWAVDYVLVDAAGNKIQNPISYRDSRTNDTIPKVTSILSQAEIYRKTGIQFLNFNTLYQLFEEDPNLLAKTSKIMMIPDYLGFVLTGKAVMETTNASTTQLLNLHDQNLDPDLLKIIKIAPQKFPKLVNAGTFLGPLKDCWYHQYDLPKTQVITVATHDTASAVVGTPGFGNNWAYLSSGTWSLLGCELTSPINGSIAFQSNYTNEGGAYGKYRFLKNIMGLWIIQQVQRELKPAVDFPELVNLAQQEPPFKQYINVNDSRFLNPPNGMITEIKRYCQETHQSVPQTPGEIAMAIYSNLALYYTHELKVLERIVKQKIAILHIVGGGSQVNLMNQLTASLAQTSVAAGPKEATALGNIIVQMITQQEIADLNSGRKLIADSFPITEFKPQETEFALQLANYEQFLRKE